VDNPTAGVDVVRVVTVLSISRFEEDHLAMERTFDNAEATLYPNCRVRIIRCTEAAGALPVLRGARIPIVVCDADEWPGGWEQIPRELQVLSPPPCLILSSRFADDRLYMEAAKRGAFEVLAKPIHGSEALRLIRMAWLHWQHRYGLPAAEPEAREPLTGT